MSLLVRVGMLVVLLLVVGNGVAQQQLAIPYDVRELVKSPPSVGRLVRVSGLIEEKDQGFVLRDLDGGKKVRLDFSASDVDGKGLLTGKQSAPVEVTGQMATDEKNGKPMVVVFGVVSLGTSQ